MTRLNFLPALGRVVPQGLFSLLLATALLAETGHVAVISSLRGAAEVTVAGTTAPAALGLPLPADFSLTTGDGAKVTLLFTDGSIRFVGSKVTVRYSPAEPEAGVDENVKRVVASLLSTGDARTFHDVITGARFEDGGRKKNEKPSKSVHAIEAEQMMPGTSEPGAPAQSDKLFNVEEKMKRDTTAEVDLRKGLGQIDQVMSADTGDADTRAYLRARLFFKFGRYADAKRELEPIAGAEHAKRLLLEIERAAGPR